MSLPGQVPPQPPRDFAASGVMFAEFVSQLNLDRLPPLPAHAPHAAVLVTPWCSCPLPWFALTLATLLRREGVNVTLVWNDLCDTGDAVTFERENQLVGACLALFDAFPLLRLSAQPPAPLTDKDHRLLATAARSNAIWENLGSLPRDRVEALETAMRKVLAGSLGHIESLLSRHRFDFLVVPGGMRGNSGLFMAVGKARGVRVSTYDSNPGMVLVGVRGVAACMPDIVRCTTQAEDFLQGRLAEARAIARARLAERMSATERFFKVGKHAGQSMQLLAADQDANTYNEDVVIPLNVEWDTSAVGQHRFFRDDAEWVVETVAFVLEHTGARVAVRQHPANRTVKDGAAHLEDELRRRFGSHPRFRFIGAMDPVNTYKLMANARVVLPLSTTTGVEAAMLGKPLVLESHAYYAEQPFCQVANTRADYFARILSLMQTPSAPDAARIAAAELCYYFAAVSNAVTTCFTPHLETFAVWSRMKPDELAAEPGVTTIVRALVDDLPAAALQGRRNLDQPPGSVPLPMPTKPALPPLEVARHDRAITPLGQPFGFYPDVTLGTDVQILGARNVEIGSGTCIGDFSWLNVCVRDDKVRMRIGQCVLVGRQSMVSTGGYLEIGDYCLFGPRVSVVDADHGFSDITRPYGEQTPTLDRSIIVEENCWLGVGAVLAGHLTVGRGSVVGANAVVTQSLPPFCVAVGHPARVVKMYDPVTGAWESARTEAEQARIMDHRAQAPLPDREQYRAMLRKNARQSRVTPIVAGRGECL